MERERFTVAIPEGFEHYAAVHTPITPRGMPDTKDRYLICFPADERFMQIRINRQGSQGAYSHRQPMLFINDAPALDLTAWQKLLYEAQRWSMPADKLLTGMALTAAVEMYDYMPPHGGVGKALSLLGVRIESSIPEPKKHDALQQWIADKLAMWSTDDD